MLVAWCCWCSALDCSNNLVRVSHTLVGSVSLAREGLVAVVQEKAQAATALPRPRFAAKFAGVPAQLRWKSSLAALPLSCRMSIRHIFDPSVVVLFPHERCCC